MNIIIDLILVAVLVISAFLAAKKGLVGTIFNLLSVVIAIVLSISLSPPISEYVDTKFINPSVKGYILSVVDDSAVGKSYDEAISKIDVASKIGQMPEKLKEVVVLAGIDVDKIVQKAKQTEGDAKEAKDSLIDSIAKPISSIISRVAVTVGLFLILSVSLWFAAKLLTAVLNMIPVGKKLNLFGGILFGLLRGTAIVFIVCILFSAVTKTVPPESDNIFSQKTINSTLVLKTAISLNPIGSVLDI